MAETVAEVIARQEGYGPYLVLTEYGLVSTPAERTAYLNAVRIVEHALEDIPDPVIAVSVLRTVLTGMRQAVGVPPESSTGRNRAGATDG